VLLRYAEAVHVDVEIASIGRTCFMQRIGQARVGGVDDEVTWANCFKLGA
jgi:hypothetical protein